MSAVMSDQSSNNVAEFFSPGPGERLRAARLSMGYDLAKLASELHLTTSIVEALEADDYSGIEARVFVRGYLRNYARIVGMPVESILRQFDEKWPDDTARQSMVRQSPRLPADGGPGRGLAGVITWLLVIGIVALFLMWWRGYLDGIVPEQIRSGVAEQGVVGDAVVPGNDLAAGLPLDGDIGEADGSLRLPPPPPDVQPEEDTSASAGAVAPWTDTPGAADGSAPPSTETSADGTSSSAPALAGSTPSARAGGAAFDSGTLATGAGQLSLPAAADGAGDGGAPVVEGSKQIVLNFTGACWVDVRDSERQFKLFGEMPKGTRKVLGGTPPYKMVIGNAQAVEITVNGRPFDLAPFAKGNVARFTLDP